MAGFELLLWVAEENALAQAEADAIEQEQARPGELREGLPVVMWRGLRRS